MPTETESPVKRTHPIVLANREAEARSAMPVKLWEPAPLKAAPHPTVAALKAEADAVREAAAADLSRADSMTQAANAVAQRIASLEREKAELLPRLAAAEGRDCKAELAKNEARFFDLYGKTNMTFPEISDLNTCIESFGWLPQLEKKLPILAKMLKARVEKIDKELSTLEGTK